MSADETRAQEGLHQVESSATISVAELVVCLTGVLEKSGHDPDVEAAVDLLARTITGALKSDKYQRFSPQVLATQLDVAAEMLINWAGLSDIEAAAILNSPVDSPRHLS